MNEKICPRTIAASLTEYWSPRVIAELDDHYVKVAKVRGTLTWHAHDKMKTSCSTFSTVV